MLLLVVEKQIGKSFAFFTFVSVVKGVPELGELCVEWEWSCLPKCQCHTRWQSGVSVDRYTLSWCWSSGKSWGKNLMPHGLKSCSIWKFIKFWLIVGRLVLVLTWWLFLAIMLSVSDTFCFPRLVCLFGVIITIVVVAANLNPRQISNSCQKPTDS